MINLYSTNCPKCNILEKKLLSKNIEYNKITEFNPEELTSRGFYTAPVIEINGTFYDFKDANNYINSIK